MFFSGLAFENLAGDADIVATCPRCRQALEHCNEVVGHRGSDKTKARNIFAAAHPNVSSREFNAEIWSGARNKVFHGAKYPDPPFLAALYVTTEQLRLASERQIQQDFGLKVRQRPAKYYDQAFFYTYYTSWRTSDSSLKFAGDFPSDVVSRFRRSPATLATELSSAMEAKAIRFKNERDFAGW